MNNNIPTQKQNTLWDKVVVKIGPQSAQEILQPATIETTSTYVLLQLARKEHSLKNYEALHPLTDPLNLKLERKLLNPKPSE